jgi:glycosyl transferase, family 25
MPSPGRLQTLLQFKFRHYRFSAAHLVRSLLYNNREDRATWRVYIVSVPRLVERHSRVLNQLPGSERPIWSFTIGGDFDHVTLNAAALSKLPKLRLFHWKLNSPHRFWGRSLKYGEIACSLNHLSCWEDAATRSVRFCIIFENDVALKCNFEHIGTTIADLHRFDRKWDLLYLGRSYRRPDLPVGGGFVKPRFSYGAFAYCLSAAGVRKLLAYDFRSMLMPVDEFLPATYGQHPRKDLAEAIIPSLCAYALEADLADVQPYGSETEASAFVE